MINACFALILGIILIYIGLNFVMPIEDTIGFMLIFMGFLCFLIMLAFCFMPDKKR